MTVFEKIEQQQKGIEETTAYYVGEQLKDICSDKRCAELVSVDLDNPDMSISKAEQKISDYAREHKHGSQACVPPKVADKILRDFYGLADMEQKKEASIISLDDFI